MKQILQNLKTGVTEIVEMPCPKVNSGELLIRTKCSLISSGTERMLLNFSKASLLGKARQQPDKLKQVIDKIKTDGVVPTVETVFAKLEQPIPLGYCNVGVLLEAGKDVMGFSIGDRIVSNGSHAEVVCVPKNLCVRIPDAVSDEAASFTVIGAVALQGIRLIKPTLGETVVVFGLGLVGQLAIQLLRASGCRVLGIDFDPVKLNLAKSFGAEVVNIGVGEDPILFAEKFSRGRGVDAVLITTATQSSEPVHQAALMCRKRGRIVLVGVAGLNLIRDDFFKKELTFQVSASYGPGRYDHQYENFGHDYPIGFVRWTEQRNFEAVLDMLSDGRLNVDSLITHRFSFEQAKIAYELVEKGGPAIGILLDYSNNQNVSNQDIRNVKVSLGVSDGLLIKSKLNHNPRVAVIGAGKYAIEKLIPALRKAGAHLCSAVSNAGVGSIHAVKKYGFEEITSDCNSLFQNDSVDALVIATRHDSHAFYTLKALQAGKSLFVEKPLCLNLDELEAIRGALTSSLVSPILMVGFNRRFSPHIKKIKKLLSSVRGPVSFLMTVNAGFVEKDHWIQNPDVGGGRVVGEACHFIDLLRFLADSRIVKYSSMFMQSEVNDTVSIELEFQNGSIGTIHYFSNGSKSFPKERLEVFASGRVLQLDNFKKLIGFGWPGFTSMNLWRQDKGQNACMSAFINAVKLGEGSPIPIDEIIEVAEISINVGRHNH